MTSASRVIAIDLLDYGKSLPPETVRYWEREYNLRKAWCMAFWVAFSEALELDLPVFMGSSKGLYLAGDLA